MAGEGGERSATPRYYTTPLLYIAVDLYIVEEGQIYIAWYLYIVLSHYQSNDHWHVLADLLAAVWICGFRRSSLNYWHDNWEILKHT